MAQAINFSDLQTVSLATTGSQILIRLDNSLSGSDGFARVRTLNFQNSLPLYAAYQSTSGLAVTNITVTSPLATTGGKTPLLSITPATTGAAGSMSSADKIKLNSISAPYTFGTGISSIRPVFAGNEVTGDYSTIVGGYSNVVSGDFSLVGGDSNIAPGNLSIAFGSGNYSNAAYVIGSNNSGENGAIVFGADNSIDSYNGIGIGTENTISPGSTNSVVIGTLNSVSASATNAWAIGNSLTNNFNNSMMFGPDSVTKFTIRGDTERFGFDTESPIAKFQMTDGTIALPTADISGNTVLTASSKYLQNYVGVGGHTITLPACSTGNGLTFVIKNAGTGPVTVSRAGSDTIFESSSATSVILGVGESGTFVVRSASQWIMTLSYSSPTGVSAGTYGSSVLIPTFTVDSKGRVLSAGAIPVGNASSATILQTGRTIGMTGDITWTTPTFNGSANVTAAGTLSSTGVIAGTYGSSTLIPTFNIDSKGRVLSAGSISVPPLLLPVWDTSMNTGTLTGSAFLSAFNIEGGTLRIKGSRPTSEGFGEVFTFLNAGGGVIGPAVYETSGVLQVRIRDSAANDIISYNSTARSTPEFDLVINWSTSAATNRHAVWINGVLQTPTSAGGGSFATTQTQLRWGASNLAIDHLAYYTSRSGTPILLGSAASSPLLTQGVAVPNVSGGSVIDIEARAAINSLLASLRASGYIAT